MDTNATKGSETRCHGNMETCQSPPYISANTDVIGLTCNNKMCDFLSNMFRQKIKELLLNIKTQFKETRVNLSLP